MQTNDLQVLQVLSSKKAQTSARVAEKLGLTPFQITARLASMEKRGLTKRSDDKSGWLRLLSVEEAKNLQVDKTKTGRSLVVDTDAATLRRDSKTDSVNNTRGWTFRYFWMSGDHRVIVFTTPNNQHYTYAEPSEPADLLVDFRERKIGMIRLRSFNKQSSVYRRLYRERGRELESMGYSSTN